MDNIEYRTRLRINQRVGRRKKVNKDDATPMEMFIFVFGFIVGVILTILHYEI
jgi:hypothetical protein